jgi:hypothetical protein
MPCCFEHARVGASIKFKLASAPAVRLGGHARLADAGIRLVILSSFFPFTLIRAEHINMPSLPNRIPVLLLKTKSTPNDSYEEYFSDEPFTPTFVPVLEHRPNLQNLDLIHSLLLDGKFGRDDNAKYGGMIFTSQRAVEGFAKVVDEVEAHRCRTRNELELTSSWLTS